ncbi:MAG: ABC transporter ATP-binding protein [Actinomycetota bacterium]|nr:ABC transporter ATP-binding protein [Actinomycetota bacterium]
MALRAVGRCFAASPEPVWAVREADLVLEAGTFACLLGESGSGKSTLLNLIAGLDAATSGTIVVDGSDVGAMDEDQRARMRLQRVGVVFQDHNLIEEFSAVENVMLPLEAVGMSPARARETARAELERVGLAGLEERFPAELSGGQCQRVGIARALMGGRRILLADEPTGALDSVNSRALFELLRGICDEGTTVVLATHELMSREFADVVYELHDGTPTRVDAR